MSESIYIYGDLVIHVRIDAFIHVRPPPLMSQNELLMNRNELEPD